ncbi:glycosyltransferase [Cohnella panacarvi]|uniref:glycosyltransferase n=1 Tax=Cohnella panacarvi TaxID=400776 RepID=UPI00047ECED3|nr:glycosyltransferase [Cohnella panacarvi]
MTSGKPKPFPAIPHAVSEHPSASLPSSLREQSIAVAREWRRRNANRGTLPMPEGFWVKPTIDPYEAWLEVNRWNERREKVHRTQIDKLKRRPLLSVIMPVYHPHIPYLDQAIESVRRQAYSEWELCIVDDASTDPSVREAIRRWSRTDGRIRASFSENNEHISVATNKAVAMASGEFLAFLDQDDVLTPDALGEVAAYANAHPDADIIYSDDDKLDTAGRRVAPQFKPGWSPELLLSYMYFGHLFVVRTALFRAAGGMRRGFEGSQDYDLALRIADKARRIGHIPRILYHWRIHPGSTSSGGGAKPYSFEAGRKAAQDAWDRSGVRARVVQPDWAFQAGLGIFAPVFPDDGPKVVIVICTRNRHGLLRNCLESLERTSYRNWEAVIVDNGSDDPESIRYLQSVRHRVIQIPDSADGFDYARLNNEAVKRIDAEYVLFLNNDTEALKPQWLSQMVGWAQRQGVGAVGARLLFPDGHIQHAGVTHGLYKGMAGPSFKRLPARDNGYMSLARANRNCAAVTGACLLTPRKLFMKFGGFDERAFKVAYNDVDYGYRLRAAGYRIVYCADAELTHHEGASRGFVDHPAEAAAFRAKYGFATDPYYNDNLSLDNERFDIRSKTAVTERFQPIPALMCAYNLNWEGSAYSQFELTVLLKDKGIIDPIVYCAQDGPLRQAYEKQGIRVEVAPHPLTNAWSYDSAIDRFAGRIGEWNVQLVYANTLETFYGIEAAKRLNVPSVWNVRESEPWQTYYDRFGSEIAARALGCFAYPYRVVFVSDATRSEFRNLESRLNFETIHSGLDRKRLLLHLRQEDRNKLRSALGFAGDECIVLLLGTVCERKGQIDLAEATLRMTRETVSKCRFLIVGDRHGEYSERLRWRVESLPPDLRTRVHVIPETSEAPSYMAIADIAVCTSRVESFPRVILEAMAYGLPIVTTPVYGITEQVQGGISGLFYMPGDTATLARHIETLANDPALRRTMGTYGRYLLDSMNDSEAMAIAYGNVFQEAWLSGEARACAE